VHVSSILQSGRYKTARSIATGLVLVCGVSGCSEAGSETRVALPDLVDFNFDVKPILADRCFHCHGPDAAVRESELRLDTREGAFRELAGEPGAFAIVPGDLDASVLYRRISSDDPNERMPPPESHRTLAEHEIALLGRWIEQGAEWREHWAFIQPEKPPLPTATGAADAAPAGNEIDAFVEARLDREGLRRGTTRPRGTAPLTARRPGDSSAPGHVGSHRPAADPRGARRISDG
jgi:hypothetical protein